MADHRSNAYSEKVKESIDKLAKIIVKGYGMGSASILILETLKPAAFIGGTLGKVLLTPWLPIFGEGIESSADYYLSLFTERDNIENLLKRIEELMKEEDENKKAQKKVKNNESFSKRGKLNSIYRWFFGK